MAKANIHVKRHLTPIERSTIAVALELLARFPDGDALDTVVQDLGVEREILSDADTRALLVELTTARKVKVCRSKVGEL